jgi:hypothetical protein
MLKGKNNMFRHVTIFSKNVQPSNFSSTDYTLTTSQKEYINTNSNPSTALCRTTISPSLHSNNPDTTQKETTTPPEQK